MRFHLPDFVCTMTGRGRLHCSETGRPSSETKKCTQIAGMCQQIANQHHEPAKERQEADGPRSGLYNTGQSSGCSCTTGLYADCPLRRV